MNQRDVAYGPTVLPESESNATYSPTVLHPLPPAQ